MALLPRTAKPFYLIRKIKRPYTTYNWRWKRNSNNRTPKTSRIKTRKTIPKTKAKAGKGNRTSKARPNKTRNNRNPAPTK